MAIFIMSAALPCIGAFIAFRSAYPRTMLFLELMSGNIRLRPLIVSTYPFSRAICMLLSIYSFIWGYVSKYPFISSLASDRGILSLSESPNTEIP